MSHLNLLHLFDTTSLFQAHKSHLNSNHLSDQADCIRDPIASSEAVRHTSSHFNRKMKPKLQPWPIMCSIKPRFFSGSALLIISATIKNPVTFFEKLLAFSEIQTSFIDFHMITPQNRVFFAYYSIISHYFHPVFSYVIDVDIPNWATSRVFFIPYLYVQKSLHIVVHILFCLIIGERNKVGLKLISLILIKCYPVHHMGKSELRFICTCVELKYFMSLWVFNIHCKIWLQLLFQYIIIIIVVPVINFSLIIAVLFLFIIEFFGPTTTAKNCWPATIRRLYQIWPPYKVLSCPTLRLLYTSFIIGCIVIINIVRLMIFELQTGEVVHRAFTILRLL